MNEIKNTNSIPPSPQVCIDKLNPFGKFCVTIGMIPSSYKTSLTYEEQLLWFCNYLEETVIPAVNNNAEATKELQELFTQLKNYVDNYFTNLDVQEEINNKLDTLVVNGTLTQLIGNYIQPRIDQQNEVIENNLQNQNNRINSFFSSQNTINNNLQYQINGLSSGSPIPVSSISAMTDTSKVYLLTTSGHWYYYNGNSWTDGGVYQSAEDSQSLQNLENMVSEKLSLKTELLISSNSDNQSTGSIQKDDNNNYSFLYNLINYYVACELFIPVQANDELFFYLESINKDLEQLAMYLMSDETTFDNSKAINIPLKKNEGKLIKININDYINEITNNQIIIKLRDFSTDNNQLKFFVFKNKSIYNMPFINLNSLNAFNWLNKNDVNNYPFIKKSNNLFDKNNIVNGFIDPVNGVINSSDNYITSDFIEVKKDYLISSINQELINMRFIAEFDVGKHIIGKDPSKNSNINTLHLDNFTKFVRISLPISYNLDLYMLQENNSIVNPLPFEPFGTFINKNYLPEYINTDPILTQLIKNSPLYGKKVAWLGSSITEHYNWCKLVNSAFNFNAKNCGVGGTTMCYESEASMCTKTRLQGNFEGGSAKAIPSDVDIIFIECGTNDWARNFALGNKELTFNSNNTEISLDLSKFKSACHQFFKNATELFPNAKIIAVGTPFGKLANRDIFNNKYGILNNQNLQSTEYGNALVEIANMWGFYGFNFGNLMNINDNNIATIIPDGLHLTTPEAYTRAGKVVINELLKIQK